MDLTSKNVNAVFIDCLYRAGEETTDHVPAEGIVQTFGFHPERLAGHADDIASMLLALPHQFMSSKSGGWSFLNAVLDDDGRMWGQQRDAEQLIALGIALDMAVYQFPRELWRSLPGGVPYIVVNDTSMDPVT